ncbi:cytochrome P450 [Streptosporangium sp. NPDC002524]|uniref:cytochrome P450 family protein n=1 Tax=Streptosporangium sp. NPDC002524 TaxID=3154537 RepID=UPI00332E0E28
MSETTLPLSGIPDSALTDPYPFYERLRAAGRVHRMQTPIGLEAWFVPHYEDARALLVDPRFSKAVHHSDGPSAGDRKRESSFANNMVSTDPPEHTRLRKLVQKAFTHRRTELLRPRVQEFTDRLLDKLEKEGRADLMEDFAFPLPMMVIGELLGLPPEDLADLREKTVFFFLEESYEGNPVQRFREKQASIGEYVRKLIEYKRTHPGDDLVHGLIEARDGENRLSEKELVATVMLLIFAGFLTTVNLITNGLHALLVNRDQLALLAARPELINSAIEEFLRYESSLALIEGHATEDIEIGDTTIPSGSLIIVSVHSVNRDPAAFPDPNRLDITRNPNPHLAFSHGLHHCLGAPLARLEAQVAINAVLKRFPGLTLDCAPEDVTWHRDFFSRSLHALPVRLAP